MHRAEKSSSKICRAREVEKAQELHRKKIDGVKSYLCGVIPKPEASRLSSSFRLRPARSMMGSFSSVACVPGDPPLSDCISSPNSTSSGDLGKQLTSKGGDNSENNEMLILDYDSSSTKKNEPIDDFQRSLAKMEEFRGVVSVPGLGSVAPAKQFFSTFAPPPAGSRRKSLNGSFRARRLKEIKVDNTEVFNRIRKSVSHYRNDDLRREWHQNLSYLSSISEFPVSVDSLTSPTPGHKHHITGDDSRNCFGPSPRRPSFLKASTRTEPLPSIPIVAHPIRSIPTSPKKLQLNMYPAFRSLRKAMPQQPSLPPISSPHIVLNASEACGFSSDANNKLSSSPRGRTTCPCSPAGDNDFMESTTGHGLSYRSSTAAASTKFIGDLHGKQAESEVSGDAKYQLLKTGRFVGGTYLVLTVFCGDGVTNPYGFDVFAYHRELKCEYKLSITKEMTHELLEKSSSSSLAAETAAAAGTNLSMQEIARNICDQIHFALLGADQGEMIFLAPSVEQKSDQAMRFDASPSLVACCLHQTVELEEAESDKKLNDHGHGTRFIGRKRRLHVFASICPPASYPTCEKPCSGTVGTTGITVQFQLMENLPPTRCTPPFSESIDSSGSTLTVEVSVDELYDILFDSWGGQNRILSMDRVVIAAIQHLHLITVPSDDGSLRNELIFNANLNTLLHPCSSRPTGTTILEKKRSQQQLPRSTSQLLTEPMRSTILFQSGLVWRNAYLLAEVSREIAENTNDSWDQRRQLVQDVDCDLVVSVFNSNSGRSSCRNLSPAKVAVFLERFEKSCTVGATKSDLHTFAEELLTRLQLDVDLFGHEVIIFPSLESANQSNCCDAKGSEKTTEKDTATSPEEHIQEFLPRTTSWEEENISEGDEGADSEAFDEEGMYEATGLSSGIIPYDTDEEEEREEADTSYSSYANQDEEEAELDATVESLKAMNTQDDQEETPERDDEVTILVATENEKADSGSDTDRLWRQGRKIAGRFCLLQGSPDNTAGTLLAMSIAPFGQLEALTTATSVPLQR